jgi:hypothetical protein
MKLKLYILIFLLSICFTRKLKKRTHKNKDLEKLKENISRWAALAGIGYCPDSRKDGDDVLANNLIKGYNMKVLSTIQLDIGDRDYKDKFMYSFLVGDGSASEGMATNELVITISGTNSFRQLVDQFFKSNAIQLDGHNKNSLIMSYFRDLYLIIKDNFITEFKKVTDNLAFNDVLVTGHSLGGAMATLLTKLLVDEKHLVVSQIKLVTFGCPRIGNEHFAEENVFKEIKNYRIINSGDVIPDLPTSIQHHFTNDKTQFWHHIVEPYVITWNGEILDCFGNPDKLACKGGSYDISFRRHIYYYDLPIGSICYQNRSQIEEEKSQTVSVRLENLLSLKDLRNSLDYNSLTTYFGLNKMNKLIEDNSKTINTLGNNIVATGLNVLMKANTSLSGMLRMPKIPKISFKK